MSGDPVYERVDLDLPDGDCLGSVYALVSAANGHDTLPDVMPMILIETHAAASPWDPTIEATGKDTSGTVAEYEAPHQISASLNFGGILVTPERGFSVVAAHEGGAGSVQGDTITSFICLVR